MKKMLTEERIASIISNQGLAKSIHRSIDLALQSDFLQLNQSMTVWKAFQESLNSAIVDIESHPRGKLFQRLIEYGPHEPDYPPTEVSDGITTLSDTECAECINFIYGHMINKFKGELAELLALEPCIDLLQSLRLEGDLPSDFHFYFGSMVQARKEKKISDEKTLRPRNFSKGPDGLVIKRKPAQKGVRKSSLVVHGIIEVKSMAINQSKILFQLNKHIARLRKGLKLGKTIYKSDQIKVRKIDFIRIIIVPSNWAINRDFKWENLGNKKQLKFPKPDQPIIGNKIDNLEPNTWKITLSWSKEALEQAAFEMSFWYMSQVGKHIYSSKNIPSGWGKMTPEEAGYNAIKMMLYYLPFRYISKIEQLRAIRLYNVYSFGYQLGIDSKTMLWPDDFDLISESAKEDWQQFQEKVALLFKRLPQCRVFIDHTMQSSTIEKIKVDVFVQFGIKKEQPITTAENHDLNFEFNVIIECKYWKTRIPQEKIFALKTIMRDTGADRGILVTKSGIQKGVRKYLKYQKKLWAVTYDELEAYVLKHQLPIRDQNLKELQPVICTDCGIETLLVFHLEDGCILCRDCYNKHQKF